MSVTFNLELNPRAGSNNETTVFIRITRYRRMKRVSTGVSIPVKSWDKVNQRVKKSHPLAEEYNRLLQESLKRVITVYSQLFQQNGEVSLDEIIHSLNHQVNENFFDFAYRTKMAEIESTNKLGTYRKYAAVLNKFRSFTGDHLTLNQVNYDLLKRYEVYLTGQLRNTRNTVSSNLGTIRTIINEAIRHGVYRERNPFQMIKLRYEDKSKEKLTVEELQRFMHNPIPEIFSLQLARDFFIACFLAEGTRAGDMIGMKRSFIENNCLVFTQRKTGTPMVIPIVPELSKIFNRYMTGEGQYIFPMLNGEPVVNEIIIGSKLAYINKYLKELCKYCGIFKRVSTHCARHTFTDLALQVTNDNIYQVQKSLGHSSVKTTEIYSRKRVNFERKSPVAEILKHLI